MKVTKKRITAFQQFIFSWWADNRRDLPWRRTHDPYKILVSEVMLQQTQVLRVIAKYAEFTQRYPTVTSLAAASTTDILHVWKGMGYNRRALYLKQTAEIVVKKYSGQFPISEQLLSEFPGVGTYTARAILVFAYKKNIAAVDTNIRKIITHHFFSDKPQKESVIQSAAEQILPKEKSWEWHQALMDYGALAMPNVKWPMLNKKKTIPFKNSNRFYRGRIMDLLREKERKQQELLHYLVRTYERPAHFFLERIDDLINDGLAQRSTYGIIHLPQ